MKKYSTDLFQNKSRSQGEKRRTTNTHSAPSQKTCRKFFSGRRAFTKSWPLCKAAQGPAAGLSPLLRRKVPSLRNIRPFCRCSLLQECAPRPAAPHPRFPGPFLPACASFPCRTPAPEAGPATRSNPPALRYHRLSAAQRRAFSETRIPHTLHRPLCGAHRALPVPTAQKTAPPSIRAPSFSGPFAPAAFRLFTKIAFLPTYTR